MLWIDPQSMESLNCREISLIGFEIPTSSEGGYGGFVAVINDGVNEYLAVWGCTRLSKKYYDVDENIQSYESSGVFKENTALTNYIDVSQNFTNSNMSNVVSDQMMSNYSRIFRPVSFENYVT